MARYGIGYQGSKSAIAEDIINALPAGRRLVDLFGGGFAISHCALLSGKWNEVWYNDINPLLPPLIRDAIAGKYNYENFIPEWISREEFHARKNTDGYVKYCWSFACNGQDYLFGEKVEETKRAGHEWVFYGTPIPGFDDLHCDLPCTPQNFCERRNVLRRYADEKKASWFELQHLEQIDRLQRLQRLEEIEHLQRPQQIELLQRLQRLEEIEHLQRPQQIELTSIDYREYEYREGDVVYCDIPYQNVRCSQIKKQYQVPFDHAAFYKWAVESPFPVYFSSYKLGGIVWEGDKRITLSAQNNSLIRREVLYCADNDFEAPKKYYQGWLFQ